MRLLEKSETLRLGGSETSRLAVVADTHSRPHPNLLEQLAELAPNAILHAGDIGDLGVLDALGGVAPVHAVRGNIDVHDKGLPDVLTIEVEATTGATALRVLLLHIGITGARLRADVAKQARARHASVVVCGHSHVPFIGTDRDMLIFNPGSAGPRRFQLPIVFGVMELSSAGVRMRHIDCTTGKLWLPPGM